MLYGDLKYFIWAFFHDGYEKKKKLPSDNQALCFSLGQASALYVVFFSAKKKKKSLILGVGEDGFSSAKPRCCSFVTPWIYRPRTPIAVSLSAGSGVIVSGHSPSSALLAASEALRDDDITLSGAANEFSGVDHRPLSGPYGHQKHADESERCRCGKAKASPAVCTLCAPLARINAWKFSFRARR